MHQERQLRDRQSQSRPEMRVAGPVIGPKRTCQSSSEGINRFGVAWQSFRQARPRADDASDHQRSLRRRRLRYSTLGGVTASRIERTIASGVMPSASPSKFRITRCRSAGRATARMSSMETLNRPSRSA